uniref:Putative secreted protein n=1 Tax=Anopheles triannulatus TaxID=58253 RepID=A0A2M4B7T0_9DIPT
MLCFCSCFCAARFCTVFAHNKCVVSNIGNRQHNYTTSSSMLMVATTHLHHHHHHHTQPWWCFGVSVFLSFSFPMPSGTRRMSHNQAAAQPATHY